MTHIHDIKGGLLIPMDPTGWSIALAKLEGRRVVVDLEAYRQTRSGKQSRYYHGVVLKIIGDEIGYYKDEIKAALAHKFLSEVDDRTGLMRIRGTSDLTTAEFEEFMARVRQWAGEEMGIFVPLPNEYLISDMKPRTVPQADGDTGDAA